MPLAAKNIVHAAPTIAAIAAVLLNIMPLRPAADSVDTRNTLGHVHAEANAAARTEETGF